MEEKQDTLYLASPITTKMVFEGDNKSEINKKIEVCSNICTQIPVVSKMELEYRDP
jgi:hypothetical protein